jgi:hypothetical protein
MLEKNVFYPPAPAAACGWHKLKKNVENKRTQKKQINSKNSFFLGNSFFLFWKIIIIILSACGWNEKAKGEEGGVLVGDSSVGDAEESPTERSRSGRKGKDLRY